MAKKSKYYVVWEGNEPGIYESWADCQLQIKGYPNAKYKSFKTKEEAEDAYGGSYVHHYEKKSKVVSQTDPGEFEHEIDWTSISVDAACSGNPGIMEYRGVYTKDQTEIFRMGPFTGGTNNVGEFLALVHALAQLKKEEKEDVMIYSDSRTAMAWVRNKRVKTTLKKTKHNAVLFKLIDRAIVWLEKNEYKNPIVKWETKRWGEIPADFGRK